jgi:lipid A 3-O-deacylase PagL
MTGWRALTAAAIVCVAVSAAAQDKEPEDTRTQYPAFLVNSYFTIDVGSIGYLFSGQQLQPGFQAESIDKPRLAVRLDFFGHHFSKYFSAQVTYMRPVRFVAYNNVNGDRTVSQVSNAYAGLTLTIDVPLNERAGLYVEGGGGVTSRSGFDINGRTALQPAHYAAGMLGGGVALHATPTIDVVVGGTYSPGRKSFDQPSTRLYTAGLRYQMKPLPAAQVEENRRGGYAFPANIVRLGFSSNVFSYGPNDFFSRTVPIFWGGNIETERGFTFDYERNVFHTKKRFAFDLGASGSYWNSNASQNVFRTFSGYPLFRFFLVRAEPGDLYFSYSLAGPTYIHPTVIDGRETGEHFTFQDFMGVGMFFGEARHFNAELGIKHYSNGNLFTTNAAIKVPLTLTFGLAF